MRGQCGISDPPPSWPGRETDFEENHRFKNNKLVVLIEADEREQSLPKVPEAPPLPIRKLGRGRFVLLLQVWVNHRNVIE